jgi:hypothetical protein
MTNWNEGALKVPCYLHAPKSLSDIGELLDINMLANPLLRLCAAPSASLWRPMIAAAAEKGRERGRNQAFEPFSIPDKSVRIAYISIIFLIKFG